MKPAFASPKGLLIALALMGVLANCSKKDPTPVIPAIVAPVLSAVTFADITPTSAKASGTISAVGSGTATTSTISEYGLCYGLTANPTTADTKVQAGTTASKPVDIVASLTGLKAGSAYFVRGYAIHVGGTAYGEQASFTTGSLKAPELTTADAIDIGTTTCLIVGNLTGLGTSNVVQHGHVWSSTNQTPTTTDPKTELGGASSVPKEFKSALISLSPNTTYYYRAYATSADGTGYTAVKTVKTLNQVAPTATTGDISNVGLTGATVGMNLVTVGTNTNITAGMCWSNSNQTPTVADTKTSAGANSPQFFSNTLQSLQPGTTYYVRAYATSPVGTGYGDVKTFKTLSGSVPTVETGTPSTVSLLYAYIDNVKLLTLGTTLTAKFGLCWSSTNQNPTPADSKDERGPVSSPTYFIASMPNLKPGTTYYYRAYGTNSVGTSYGEVKTLTTQSGLPVVQTNSDGVLGGRTVFTIGGKIVSGGPTLISVYGHCWSATNKLPTTADSKNGLIPTNSQAILGIGKYVSDLTNLAPNTTYYMRGYATNSYGTGYGDVYTFTTQK